MVGVGVVLVCRAFIGLLVKRCAEMRIERRKRNLATKTCLQNACDCFCVKSLLISNTNYKSKNDFCTLAHRTESFSQINIVCESNRNSISMATLFDCSFLSSFFICGIWCESHWQTTFSFILAYVSISCISFCSAKRHSRISMRSWVCAIWKWISGYLKIENKRALKCIA